VSFTVPILLMILCVGLAVMMYLGGFSEERRSR
jgi:hypothetical protein